MSVELESVFLFITTSLIPDFAGGNSSCFPRASRVKRWLDKQNVSCPRHTSSCLVCRPHDPHPTAGVVVGGIAIRGRRDGRTSRFYSLCGGLHRWRSSLIAVWLASPSGNDHWRYPHASPSPGDPNCVFWPKTSVHGHQIGPDWMTGAMDVSPAPSRRRNKRKLLLWHAHASSCPGGEFWNQVEVTPRTMVPVT